MIIMGEYKCGAARAVFISFGNWQMFPRDEEVLQIIQDGRWQKEPNPVKWAIMPYMAVPVGVRRSAVADLTAALMAPPDDCFAISTPGNSSPV